MYFKFSGGARNQMCIIGLTFIRHVHKVSTSELMLDELLSEKNRLRCINTLQKGSSQFFMSKTANKTKLKDAGVMVPLCQVNGKASILYTIRSSVLNEHRGEVSFPGGRVSTGDRNIEHTATREMHEEVGGINADNVAVWGQLSQIPSKSMDTIVTAVIAYIGEINVAKLQPNYSEVAKVFTVPIESLCDLAHCHYTYFRKGGRGLAHPYSMPVFTSGEQRIWGLTAIVTHQTLKLVAPQLYRFNPYKILSSS